MNDDEPIGADRIARGEKGARGRRGREGGRGLRGEPAERLKLPRRVFLAFIALALGNAIALYMVDDAAQTARDALAANNRLTADICERQEIVSVRLIDTKEKIKDTNRILLALIEGVRRQADSAKTGSALRVARDALRTEIRALRDGQRMLQNELDAVDCPRSDKNHVPLPESLLPSAQTANPQGAQRAERGARGPRGQAGPAGTSVIGPQGARGSRGLPGVRGPRGHRGSRGHRGPPGPQGPRGPRGEATSTAGLTERIAILEQRVAALDQRLSAFSLRVCRALRVCR